MPCCSEAQAGPEQQAEHTDLLPGTCLAGAPLEPGHGKLSTPDLPPANP